MSFQDHWSMDAYGTSKLCNLLYALALNRRVIGDRVVVNAVHPGNMVATSKCTSMLGVVILKMNR
jgi:NAD(P)-dependent dehydrogenase (short-subunit alcohol dehydrogenase family)